MSRHPPTSSFFAINKKEVIAMDKNQTNDVTWYRDMFALFSKAFYRPEKDVAGPWITCCLREINDRFALGFEGQIRELEQWLTENDRLHALRLEHSRLFVGPFSLPAPPYESCYRENRVMGDCTMDVKRYYRLAGLEVSAEFKDAPDHVVLETDFLSKLYEAENDALEREDLVEAERLRGLRDGFIREHAGLWLSSFALAVKNSASLPYYALLSAILASVADTMSRQRGAVAC